MRASWKLQAGYKLETGQLDRSSYKLESWTTGWAGQLGLTPHELEIPGLVDELESWKLNCELEII